jgi:hypothetical protein
MHAALADMQQAVERSFCEDSGYFLGYKFWMHDMFSTEERGVWFECIRAPA